MQKDPFSPLLAYRSSDPPDFLRNHLREDTLVVAAKKDPVRWRVVYEHLVNTIPPTDSLASLRRVVNRINNKIGATSPLGRGDGPDRVRSSSLWTPSTQIALAPASRFRLWSVDEILNAPAPAYLLDKHLVQGSLAFLYGPSGVGKSFLALDWACCVATGTSWLGHPVVQGAAIYVAAEGSGGLQKRLMAWKEVNGLKDIPNLHFLTEPLNLRNPVELRSFMEMVTDLDPVLISLDTFARCIAGAEENSAKEMGQAIEGMDLIRSTTSAAVLGVHHSGKSGEGERGSSAIRAAADTMMKLSGGRGLLRLECDKQKDDEPFAPTALVLESAGRSCVVRSGGPSASATSLNESQQTFLDALPPGRKLSIADMCRAGAGSESTCRRMAPVLAEKGFLEDSHGRPKTHIAWSFPRVLPPPTRATTGKGTKPSPPPHL